MTKKRLNPSIQDNTPDYLVKPKTQFGKDLAERIKIGEDLLKRQISNNQEYTQLDENYNLWHDFNKEFLKRAFNRANNQYYMDYVETPLAFFASSTYHTPSFSQQIDGIKSEISKYLTRLIKIREKLILIDEHPDATPTHDDNKTNIEDEALKYLEKIFSKFHRVAQSIRNRHANRETLTIKDEYDVQDLLYGLLKIHFDDIRVEDYSPSYAGGNSRIDFVLKNEKIVVEVKMTNEHLKDKDIGSQLLIDIGRYRAHPDCQVLVVFIYDKGDYIRNKIGIINDLENTSSQELKVKVFIDPK